MTIHEYSFPFAGTDGSPLFFAWPCARRAQACTLSRAHGDCSRLSEESGSDSTDKIVHLGLRATRSYGIHLRSRHRFGARAQRKLEVGLPAWGSPGGAEMICNMCSRSETTYVVIRREAFAERVRVRADRRGRASLG